ncbi:MAG: glucuronate isomerase [Solirubrobacteraceae bacterium]|jgi:glucuronate isomerase
MTAPPPHPDRLLGVDPAQRTLARELYAAVADAPIISPHGHVSAEMLATNQPFADPAALFVTPDHYVTRLLHSAGVELGSLGLGGSTAPPREIWRTLCSNWRLFAGTPVRYWLEDSLFRVFGLSAAPAPDTADALYDQLAEQLLAPAYRPRELLAGFGVELLATTDDPADSLEHHRHLSAIAGLPTQVVPTLRADAYMTPDAPAWRGRLDALSSATGEDCASYDGLLRAIRNRREFFKQHGATATDCGVSDAWATPLGEREAQTLHRQGLDGSISPDGAQAYRRNMLFQFGCMAAEDGLVMQLHAGVIRNHHAATFARFGPDTGHDLPAATAYTEPLRQLLNHVGTSQRFQIVLFTVDETAFSRDIAPLAGFYPSVYAGAPWWFLDAPAAVRRYRAAVTETAGFFKTSGFIDDTRALCSIPSRHDMSRRLDASYLAELVIEHQLSEEDAREIAQALVSEIPRSAFRLDRASASSN